MVVAGLEAVVVLVGGVWDVDGEKGRLAGRSFNWRGLAEVFVLFIKQTVLSCIKMLLWPIMCD